MTLDLARAILIKVEAMQALRSELEDMGLDGSGDEPTVMRDIQSDLARLHRWAFAGVKIIEQTLLSQGKRPTSIAPSDYFPTRAPDATITSDDVALATTICMDCGYGSVSRLQRRMRLGYTYAARLMDELEARGIVGPALGSEPRQVLVPPNKGSTGPEARR